MLIQRSPNAVEVITGFGGRPNVTISMKAHAPAIAIMPVRSSQRPIVVSQGECSFPATSLMVGADPVPAEKESVPVVACPSTADSTRQTIV